MVGGGLGRTPMIGHRAGLPAGGRPAALCRGVLSVYNTLGRRDNKYKARIKITVHETGAEEITRMIEARFAELRPLFGGNDQKLLAEIREAFAPPAFRNAPDRCLRRFYKADPTFRAWADTNLTAAPQRAIRHRHDQPEGAWRNPRRRHQRPDAPDGRSGEKRYGHSDLRISHEQNVILPHVHKSDLPALHARCAGRAGTANVGLISDIIACPGMDYCALATARSIPVAQESHPFRGAEAGARDRPAEDQDLGLHQRLRASPCGPYRHPGASTARGWRTTRSRLAATAPKRRDRRKTGPGFAYDRDRARHRTHPARLPRPALRAEETFLQAFRRVGWPRSRPRSTRRKARKMPRDLHCPGGRPGGGAERPLPHHSATAVLEHALKDADLGRVALVSSFGAESVVLLHLCR
jgi:sulfite reductase (NADPH) hemoprotein beta-component